MNKNNQVTLVFPIAGPTPSGFKYKPFMEIYGQTFIEVSFSPFRKWLAEISRVIFIVLEQDEKKYKVSKRINALLPESNPEFFFLNKKTAGPADSAIKAIDGLKIKGPILISDCDHSFNVDPIFNMIKLDPTISCLIPTWPLRGEDIKNWSVVSVGDDNIASAISEKKLPSDKGNFCGVVGCYYFSKAEHLISDKAPIYISDLINEFLKKDKDVKTVQIEEADFFGNKERLRKTLTKHKVYFGTIFCDLDGTIILHEDKPDYSTPIEVIPGSIEKIKEWIKSGYKIIITTARDPNDEKPLLKALKLSKIPYHELMMGIPSGPRHVINDRKPSAILTGQANAHEIPRNMGISGIEFTKHQNNVIKRFKGGSFSDTLLIEDEEKLFVRKRASKRHNLSLGYTKLKKQFKTLERFNHLSKDLTPELYGEFENSMEYFYDISYLENYKLISEGSTREKHDAIGNLLEILSKNVYSLNTSYSIAGEDWLTNHLADKIFMKFDNLAENTFLSSFVNSEEVMIDGLLYKGLNNLLKNFLSSENLTFFVPNKFGPTHGDLTFENILFSNKGQVKLIDMDGSEFIDALELDLGKMFQSILSQYESWAHSRPILFKFTSFQEIETQYKLEKVDNGILDLCLTYWSKILGTSKDQVYMKGLFFLSLHLIRMIPFRLTVSEDQALFAAVQSTKFLNKTLNDFK